MLITTSRRRRGEVTGKSTAAAQGEHRSGPSQPSNSHPRDVARACAGGRSAFVAFRRCRPHSVETVRRQYTHRDCGRYVRANTNGISNVLGPRRLPVPTPASGRMSRPERRGGVRPSHVSLERLTNQLVRELASRTSQGPIVFDRLDGQAQCSEQVQGVLESLAPRSAHLGRVALFPRQPFGYV